MKCWHSISVRALRPDVVRQWADLEGKGSTMSEDLYRRFTTRRKSGREVLPVISLFAELTLWVLEAWRLIDSR